MYGAQPAVGAAKIKKERSRQKAAKGLLWNRRGVGTCVRAYVLETRAPVCGCMSYTNLQG